MRLAYFLIALGLFSFSISTAQNFEYEAAIEKITRKGFQSIELSPDVIHNAKKNLSDLRLLDSNQKEIPYLIDHNAPEEYHLLPVPEIVSKANSKNKTTEITFSFTDTMQIDKIQVHIEGPRYYYRRATMEQKYTKGKTKSYPPLREMVLMSGQDNKFLCESIRDRKFYLTIENEDNPPLKIIKIDVFQRKHFLTAYFPTSGTYTIKFGNTHLKSPLYDIKHFTKKIPDSISIIKILNVQKKKLKTIEPVEMQAWFQSPAWIWSAIGAVILMLGFMSYKMIQELNKEKMG
jgi:hypothetical protein